jgi:hypothetical protein
LNLHERKEYLPQKKFETVSKEGFKPLWLEVGLPTWRLHLEVTLMRELAKVEDPDSLITQKEERKRKKGRSKGNEA